MGKTFLLAVAKKALTSFPYLIFLSAFFTGNNFHCFYTALSTFLGLFPPYCSM